MLQRQLLSSKAHSRKTRRNRRNSTVILGQCKVQRCFIILKLALKTSRRAIMIIICLVISTIKCKTKPPRSPPAIHSLLDARRRTARTNPSSPSSCPSWQPRGRSRSAAPPATTTSNDSTLTKLRVSPSGRRHNGSADAPADKSLSLLNKYTRTSNRWSRGTTHSRGRAAVSGRSNPRCTSPQ